MFELEYKGGNAVTIISKKLTIAIDPCISSLGLKDPKVSGLVELLTENRFKIADPETRLIIDGPGEYEVGDFMIRGVEASRFIDDENAEKLATIYRLEQADIAIGVIGNIGAKLSEDQLESLGIVDILVIPVGGTITLDPSSAAALVRSIEPKIVIPVHYQDAALRYEMPQEEVDVFIKELGAPVEDVPGRLKIKSAASIPATLTVYKLARS